MLAASGKIARMARLAARLEHGAKNVPSRYAWAVVFLLFCASVLNYMDRSVLSVIMPEVRRELRMTNADYGLALNAFLVAYMAFFVIGGRLADRFGSRRSLPVSLSLWSLASILHGFANSLVSLSLFRALLGVGEGCFYPIAQRAATEWFASAVRAKAVGIVLCGMGVGSLISPPAVAWLAFHFGWRAAFFFTGAIGFVLLPAWILLHVFVKRYAGAADPTPGIEWHGSDETRASDILRHRKYWTLLAARACTDAVWFFYLFWLPGYFQEIRGFNLRMTGTVLWVPFLCADIGGLTGAWSSSWMVQRFGLHRGRRSILIPSVLLGSLGSLAYFAATWPAAIAIMSVALFGHLSWTTNMNTVFADILPPRYTAFLYGVTGAMGTLAGAVFQLFTGYTVDHWGYAVPFCCAAGLFGLALIFLLASSTIEPIRTAYQPVGCT